MNRNLMRMALMMAATAAYARDDYRLDIPNGNTPSSPETALGTTMGQQWDNNRTTMGQQISFTCIFFNLLSTSFSVSSQVSILSVSP